MLFLKVEMKFRIFKAGLRYTLRILSCVLVGWVVRMDFTWASIKICFDFQTSLPVRGERLGSLLENTKTPKDLFSLRNVHSRRFTIYLYCCVGKLLSCWSPQVSSFWILPWLLLILIHRVRQIKSTPFKPCWNHPKSVLNLVYQPY